MRNLLLSVLIVSSALAQQPGFEAASIHPSKATEQGWGMNTQKSGRFVATNTPIRFLIAFAYDIREFQIVGGPGWLETDRFDINATAGGDKTFSDEDFRKILQSFLADRFQLQLHRETKEMPVYLLSVGPAGIKGVAEAKLPTGGGMHTGRGSIEADGLPIGVLTQPLAQILGRPVLDKTESKRRVDFTLKWAPDGDSDGPSIFTALQEQLGLRLDSQRAPADVFVVDGVSKPSEN